MRLWSYRVGDGSRVGDIAMADAKKLIVKDLGGRDVLGYNNWKGVVEIDDAILADIESRYQFDEGGVFVSRKTGHVACAKSGNYIVIRTSCGQKLATHRVVWARYGSEPLREGYVIDHISGDTQDNSIRNLRQVSSRDNSANRSGINKNAKHYVVLQGAVLNTLKRPSKNNTIGYREKPFYATKMVCGRKVDLSFVTELSQLKVQYGLNYGLPHLQAHALWKAGMSADEIIASFSDYTAPLPTEDEIKSNLLRYLDQNPQMMANRVFYQNDGISGFIDLSTCKR